MHKLQYLQTIRLSSILFVGVGMILLSACNKQPTDSYQQAYEQSLAEGSVNMTTLRTLDTGDIRKTREVVMTSLYVTLSFLPDFAAWSHPTPEQKQEEIKLARDVLDYMLAHRDELDSSLPSVKIGISGLQKILTEPYDIQRLTELSDYLAGVEKKIP